MPENDELTKEERDKLDKAVSNLSVAVWRDVLVESVGFPNHGFVRKAIETAYKQLKEIVER